MQHEAIRSTNTTTLEEVQKHFQQWRREKPAHNSHIPDYLWDQVAHIVEYYSQSDILKHLKISRYQLVASMKSRKKPQDMDSRAASIPQETPDNIPHNPFIKLSMPPVQDLNQNPPPHIPTTPPMEQNTSQVELIHPNGVTMRITAMSAHHISILLSSFMGMA